LVYFNFVIFCEIFLLNFMGFYNSNSLNFDRLTETGAGQVIYDLRKKIQNITFELKNINNQSREFPELIKSANLLRANEHLLEVNSKQTELLLTYKKYSSELEQMLSTVFEIQKDLKEILKTQSSLILNQQKNKTKNKKNNSSK